MPSHSVAVAVEATDVVEDVADAAKEAEAAVFRSANSQRLRVVECSKMKILKVVMRVTMEMKMMKTKTLKPVMRTRRWTKAKTGYDLDAAWQSRKAAAQSKKRAKVMTKPS